MKVTNLTIRVNKCVYLPEWLDSPIIFWQGFSETVYFCTKDVNEFFSFTQTLSLPKNPFYNTTKTFK